MDIEPKKPVVIPLFFDNYISVIKNSVGTEMFRNWYCTVDGVKTEVLGDGNLSCPLYLTGVLKIFDLVHETQITVHRALKEMETSGWKEITKPQLGAVIVWGEKLGETGIHKHMGFYLGENLAVSTNDKAKKVITHPLDYRPILNYLWHPKLDGEKS